MQCSKIIVIASFRLRKNQNNDFGALNVSAHPSTEYIKCVCNLQNGCTKSQTVDVVRCSLFVIELY